MLRQPGCRNQLSGLQHCAHDDDGPEAPATIALRRKRKTAADTQASARATTKAASLTGVVVERRALSAPDILVTSAASVTAAVSSVTVGVTDPVTVIAPALRRIRPACSQAFSRRLVRILFQPHLRPSLAALTATRPSGWERSQISASRSSRGIHSNTGRQSGSSCSI